MPNNSVPTLRECREILKTFERLEAPDPEGGCGCWWNQKDLRHANFENEDYTLPHLPDCWEVRAQALFRRLTDEALERDEKRTAALERYEVALGSIKNNSCDCAEDWVDIAFHGPNCPKRIAHYALRPPSSNKDC